ncbi:hypothetical protein AFLA_014008 [Aspergillus flavus NRRL3357]|nr:hypothetical protein AFLA_014008 [Aspergillus flavus NRRL3357]
MRRCPPFVSSYHYTGLRWIDLISSTRSFYSCDRRLTGENKHREDIRSKHVEYDIVWHYVRRYLCPDIN